MPAARTILTSALPREILRGMNRVFPGLLRFSTLATVGLLALPVAHAQDTRFGALLMPMISGELEVGTVEGDTDTALAVAPWLDFRLHPNFSLGFVPQFTFGVNGEDFVQDASTQMDLFLRATGWVPVRADLELFGFFAPGYSVILLNDDWDDLDNPAGLGFQFGGGVAFQVNRTVSVLGQIGYQWNDLETEGPFGLDFDVATRFTHIGLGLLAQM